METYDDYLEEYGWHMNEDYSENDFEEDFRKFLPELLDELI